jgi:GntR family transcriptional regulator
MLFSIDESDSRPVYLQLAAQIKDQIQLGQLKPGEALPSIRDLAESLGINLHTVRHAYGLLNDQKIVNVRLGQQTKVANLRSHPAAAAEIEDRVGRRLAELITDAFLLGLSADDFKKIVNEELKRQEDCRK